MSERESKTKKIMVSFYSKSSNETAIDHAHNTWTLMSTNKQQLAWKYSKPTGQIDMWEKNSLK